MEIGFLTNKTRSGIWGILLVAVGILLFRRLDAFANPQLWAEDGTLFLQQYYDLGVASLTTPYAGYLNTIERLIVFFWGRLDINLIYVPAAYVVTVLLLYFWLVVHLWKSAVSMQLNNSPLFAVMFLAIPITSDVFMNVTNLNGILSLLLIDFLVTKRIPANTLRYIGFLLVVLVVSLSGPTSIILCPVIFLIALMERKTLTPKVIGVMALIFVCGAYQLYLAKFVDNQFHRGVDGVHENMHLLRMFTNNMADELFMADGIFSFLPHMAQMIVSLLALGVLAFFWMKIYLRSTSKTRYILPLIAALYLASTVISYWPTESQLLALRNASRYFLVPYVCMAWWVVLELDKKIKWMHIAIYAAFFIMHARLIRFSLPDKHWNAQIMEYHEGKRDVIDINPDGWVLRLPKKK